MTAAAVLFDMDGLLIDSEPLWYAVEAAAVERMGGTWGPEHQIALIGGTLDASCRYMIELTGANVAVDELSDLLIADMAAAFRDGAPSVHEGALALIDGIRAVGVRTGLVSSSYRVIVDAALDLLGRDRFDVSVAGDEVSRGKADPEPYRTAAKLPRNAKAGDPAWRSYFRNYPKDLPGGRLKRTLAVTHTGRSGVAATVAAGAAGAGLAAHASQTLRRRKK